MMGADIPEPVYVGDELLFIRPGGLTHHETVPFHSLGSAFEDPIENYFGGPCGEAYTVTEYLDHEQSAYWLYEAIEPTWPAINLTATRFLKGGGEPTKTVWGEAVIRWNAYHITDHGQVIT
jgi:hypothetical protein